MLSVAGRRYDGSRQLIMGIVNVTPDSFSDGGRYFDTGRAVDQALKLVEEGADIIDIGGESSRPGSDPVSPSEELARVIPVITTLAERLDVPLSVDTTKAVVAKEAVGAGASIINDITALGGDPGMADVVAGYGCSVVLMHMLGRPKTMQRDPHYDDVVGEVLAFLSGRVAFAEEKGIPRERIMVDPGIGFGKTLEHNLSLIRHIGRFRETGCAVMVGVSRKSLFGMLTGAAADERVWGTAAVTAWAAMHGAAIHRVHDVRAMSDVCRVIESLQVFEE